VPKQPRTLREPITYVLRIYQQEPARVSGVLEDSRTGARHAFTAADQLWNLILAAEDQQQPEATSGAIPKLVLKETKP
jgi:hypothetical protein